jgi:transposase
MLLGKWRSEGEIGERRVADWLDRQKRRMYDVGSFMKIVKQWFTTEYNRRNTHKGTLWESAYFDRVVPRRSADMANCLAYIHLNPIRAAAADRFDGYVWSSYSAFLKGDPTAVAGMRFVYGEGVSDDEIAEAHEHLLRKLLEAEKLRRAEEIARERADGYEVSPDSLTTEAMVAQAAAHLDEVRRSLRELRESERMKNRSRVAKDAREEEVVALLETDARMTIPVLAERLGVGLSMAYHLIAGLRRKGVLERDRHKGIWIIGKTV